MATFADLLKLDIRAGEIIKAEFLKEAKTPAYKLTIDFGQELGVKISCAQITDGYALEELVGKQIIGIINFPPKQIASTISEVLLLGFDTDDGVVLARPDVPVKNGLRLN